MTRRFPVVFLAAAILSGAGATLGGLAALESIPVSITALGGSPLLLNVTLEDPDRRVTRVVVDGDAGRFERVLRGDDDTVSLRVAPFSSAGVYDLTVELQSDTETGRKRDIRSFRVGFTDYVWGRDNFRFANDGQYRGGVESYSGLFFPWLADRFGPVRRDDQVILLLHAYEILRGQLGLCYAFAGAATLYFRYPDLLPRFNESVYDIRETNRSVREFMTRLQNDIVFQRFVMESVAPEAQNHREVERELETVLSGIDRGEPVVVGVLAPERHHAMVAYGYIVNSRTGEFTIVTANNWDRDERDNHSNRSVEHLQVLGTGPPLRWPDARHAPYRNPTHILAVEVRRQYDYDPKDLGRLTEQLRSDLVSRNRRTLIFEGVRSLRLTDVPDHGDGDPPSITRINNNMIVNLPPNGRFELEVTAMQEDGTYMNALFYRIDVDDSSGGAGEDTLRIMRHTLQLDQPRRRISIPWR